MSSRCTKYREKIKETQPEKYQEYLEKQKQRAKLARERLKTEINKKKIAPAIKSKLEERRKAGRERQKKYMAKKKAMNTTTSTTKTKLTVKLSFESRKETRASEQQRQEYWRVKKRLSRNTMSHQKRESIKRKDKKYRQEKRLKEMEAKRKRQIEGFNCTKTAYNSASKARKSLPNSPTKYASVVRSLIQRCSPRKKAALKRHVFQGHNSARTIFNHIKDRNCVSAKKIIAQKLLKNATKSLIAKQLGLSRNTVGNISKKKRKRSSVNTKEIYDFYHREDISRALPQKRFATKHGPGFLLQMTLNSAFKIYKAENPEAKVSFSSFAKLRPKNVRLLSNNHREYCLCVYCVNIRYKLLVLNRATYSCGLKHLNIDKETKLIDVLLCVKSDGARFHKSICINSKCTSCKDHGGRIKQYYSLLPMQKVVTWNHWERKAQPDGRVKRILETSTQPLSILIEEMIIDITKPTQGITFVKHLHNANWQYMQFNCLKDNLPEGTVLEVFDFAKNRTLYYQDEIKSAFFGASCVTIHPIVTFFKENNMLIRDSIIILSEDNTHDYHAVHHFDKIADDHIKGVLGKACAHKVIFSDGCSSQYKSKGPFADLSLTQHVSLSRNYYGSEHGKGQSDGEIGVLNRALDKVIVGRQVILNTAKETFLWCNDNLTENLGFSRRHFYFVKHGDIQRDRVYTEVQTLPETRKVHQAKNIIGQPYRIKVRNLSCFCENCRGNSPNECINKEYVEEFKTKELSRISTAVDVESNLDDETDALSNLGELLKHVDEEVLSEFNVEMSEIIAATEIIDENVDVDPNTSTSGQDGNRLKQGQFVLVGLDVETSKRKSDVEKKKREFVAEILQITDKGVWLKYMRRLANNSQLYSWPEPDDVSCESQSAILKVLKAPELVPDKSHRTPCFQFV